MDKQKFIKPTDISGVGSPSNWFLRRFIKFPKGIPIKWSESDSHLQEISISLLSQIPQRSATQVL